MALMLKQWRAVCEDCNVLEREIDLAVRDGQPERAREGLEHLKNMLTRWIHRLLGLRKVLLEREYCAAIGEIDYYLDVFRAFSQMGRERLRELNGMEGVQ